MQRSLPRRSVVLWFSLAAAVLVWIGATAYWSTHRLVRSFDSVSASHEALEKLQSLQVLIEAAESGVGRYVITGQESAVQPFLKARQQVPRKIRQIDQIVNGHASQRKALRQLRLALLTHLDFLSSVVEAREKAGYDVAAKLIAEEDDSSPREAMEALLASVQRIEAVQVEKRSNATSKHSNKTKGVLAAAALLSLIFLAWAFSLLRQETDERHLAENATEQMEQFLRSIIARIPYMILVKETTHLRVTLANKAAEEWLGKSEADLLGSNAYDLLPRDLARDDIQKDREALQAGGTVDIPEETLALPGKPERILHTQKIVILDDTGLPAYLATISEDITERRVAQRQLELSRDAALESARLKAEFLRNMSHEIRTPLSLIVGMVTLLLDSNQTDEQRKFSSTIQRASNGLLHLTRDLLDFSKIETGTFVLDPQEFQLRPTVEGVVSMMTEQARAKGVGLAALLFNNLPATIFGDAVRVRQVLTQLVGNALKFTEKGEVIVRVTVEKQDDAKIWLQYRVTDTGIGMDEETQSHLFELFRQGDGSRTRRFGGTGLGLAMVKRIVELMGGQIGCESAPGQGSTFWFTLPFDKKAPVVPVVKVAALPWTRGRVLVADESEAVRQLLRQHLGAWALSSEAVTSGESALSLLRKEQKAGRPFQIAIIDMHLSDMEGATLARAIRRDPALASLKLLVMSPSDASLGAEVITSLGFAGTLSKPPTPEALYECLARLIEAPGEPSHQHAA